MSISDYNKSRKLLESVFWGDDQLRAKVSSEIDRLRAEHISIIREDKSREWPDDNVQFLYWCTPDIILDAINNVTN